MDRSIKFSEQNGIVIDEEKRNQTPEQWKGMSLFKLSLMEVWRERKNITHIEKKKKTRHHKLEFQLGREVKEFVQVVCHGSVKRKKGPH